MKYAAVYWTDCKTWDVVSEDAIDSKNVIVGQNYNVLWHKKTYNAKVLRVSDHKDSLEKIFVTTEGDILEFPPEEAIKDTILSKRRKVEISKKVTKLSKSESSKARNSVIASKTPVFEQKSEDTTDCCCPKVSPEVFKYLKHMVHHIEVAHLHTGEQEPEALRTYTEPAVLGKGQFVSAILPTGTSRNESQTQECTLRNNSGRKSKVADSLSPTEEIQPRKAELTTGSGVWIRKDERTKIVKLYGNNPREMVRQVLKQLFSEDQLKDMSARGSRNSNGIPPNILSTIQAFVATYSSPLADKDFTKTVNNLCSGIRNPDKKKKASDKPKGNKLEDEKPKQTFVGEPTRSSPRFKPKEAKTPEKPPTGKLKSPQALHENSPKLSQGIRRQLDFSPQRSERTTQQYIDTHVRYQPYPTLAAPQLQPYEAQQPHPSQAYYTQPPGYPPQAYQPVYPPLPYQPGYPPPSYHMQQHPYNTQQTGYSAMQNSGYPPNSSEQPLQSPTKRFDFSSGFSPIVDPNDRGNEATFTKL